MLDINQRESVKMLNRIAKFILPALLLVLSTSMAFAGDRGVFKNKNEQQHELTEREENRMIAEFKAKFSGAKTAAFQKMSKNPWEAKKMRNQHQADKAIKVSHTWGSCREYAYKKRGQCYAKGNVAYTCERYYDARVEHCDDKF